MTNSKALRDWISARGLKYKAIAERMGITPYSLQKKIDNETQFKASEIAVFSIDFGMDVSTRESLFFGTL